MTKYLPLFYQIRQLQQYNVVAAFSTRVLNYNLRAGENSLERERIVNARRKLFASLGMRLDAAVFLEQVHKANVRVISGKESGQGAFQFNTSIADCDAAVTKGQEIALCVLSADCLPVIFFEPQKQVAAIAHAGWRGTHARIVQHTLSVMKKRYATDPGTTMVFLGPGIRACCYAVGNEFFSFFPEYVRKKGAKAYFDLVRANTGQLLESGVRKENIYDSRLCSMCRRNTFFSYRGGDVRQRTLTVVMLKKNEGRENDCAVY
ncbi:MAG: peptidoglycan editing factor PgeF [Candidatus Omnitrophica bacterium]|nr:peptidoglycan editing factor PgeF [Candidatus Omnitrophota bacterium]MBU4479665.1 peptidoglycan editing factor PgeF [Candidatus Omnitrophota bacterium]MCG2703655.1 peptidoglycan editing factor PgeF [Candidatus Omnitrophota bacterium]